MKRFSMSMMMAAVLGMTAFALADAQSARRGPAGQDTAIEDGQQPGRRGAFGGPRRGGPRGGGFGSLRGLDLTDDQRAQIAAIRQAERDSAGTPDGAGPLHRQLHAELFADAPDEGKIAALQQQLHEAHAAQLARRIAVEQKIAQVLTAEQRAELRQRFAEGPRRRP